MPDDGRAHVDQTRFFNPVSLPNKENGERKVVFARCEMQILFKSCNFCVTDYLWVEA